MNILISRCLALLGFNHWSRRDAALVRLAQACLKALPSARASDWIEFYNRNVTGDKSSPLRPTPFSGTRYGPRGTFYVLCDRQHEREIVGLVRQALHDIGLGPGRVTQIKWRASRYQIPVTGIPRVTHAEAWFNTVKDDNSVILVAVSLTDL